MQITWHGHAFFELELANGKNVLIDPFVDNGVTNVAADDLDPDLILLTHGHQDHVGNTLDFDAPIVSNFEIVTYLTRQGANQESVAMNTGGFHKWEGARIWMAPALHSSGFHTDDGFLGYGGAANGFIIDDGDTKFYHAGDTGLFGDMKHVIRDVLKPDVAALPIGDLFTMGPEHAAIAVEWLGVNAAIPCHYNTFDPIQQDPQEFARRVGDAADVIVASPDQAITAEGGKARGEAVAAE